MRVVILAVAMTMACSVAVANEQADAVKPAAIADGDKVVCKWEQRTGSNLPKKICLTKSQREQIAAQARLELRESMGNNGTAPVEKPIFTGGQ